MYVKKLICLASFVVVLSLVGDVQAANVIWYDTTDDHLWSTARNWDVTLPTSVDDVRIGMLPGPTVTDENAVAKSVKVGYGSVIGSLGSLTVDGGTLTITDTLQLGAPEGSNGTLNMNSGTITVGSAFYVALKGLGTLNMTGGTITVGTYFRIGFNPTATGHVNLDGGVITANYLEMRNQAGSVGTMDVRAGTLIINGDRLSSVQGYIDNGWITAYDGNGTLQLDYDVTNEGKTTLKATHMLNPNPVNGGTVAPGEVVLSWTLPDPCVPGQPVPVDVYFTDNLKLLEEFTDPAAIQIVSKQNVTSVVVQTQPKTQYYWAVDTYIDSAAAPVLGPIFSFYTDNLPPQVDAGADIVTWLQEGPRTGNLDATVTDDAYTVQWTVVSEPNVGTAVIETATAEDTSITLSAVGEYVLQIEAFDGEYTSSDTVTINVYEDSCEAAKSLAGYEPLVGDLNGDCKVDDVDLALLQENWLKDNSLTEVWSLID